MPVARGRHGHTAGKSYRDLKVWQMGVELSLAVYKATEPFPKAELFGLVSQMRRAATSIPANIVEGFSRQHRNEFVQFLHIAKGSESELDTFIELAQRLGYLSAETAKMLSDQRDEVGRMIDGLIGSVRRVDTKPLTTRD